MLFKQRERTNYLQSYGSIIFFQNVILIHLFGPKSVEALAGSEFRGRVRCFLPDKLLTLDSLTAMGLQWDRNGIAIHKTRMHPADPGRLSESFEWLFTRTKES